MLKKILKVNKESNKKKCKKNNTTSFLNVVRQDLENSTIHGLCYILNTQIHFVERIFWLICCTGSVALIVVLLVAQYTRLIKSPPVMSVEINYFDWNVSYPAITLCPFNRINATLYQHLLDETFNRSGMKSDAFMWSVVAGGMDNIDLIHLDIPENISSLLHPNAYSKLAAEVFIKFPDNSLSTSTNWNISLEAVMTEMGMCHVINSNVAVYDNPMNWHEKNHEYAQTNIKVTIYEGDFMAQITNYTHTHYKVYIHHPDELILSTSPSFKIFEKGYVTFGLSVWSNRVSDEIRPVSISLRQCRFVNEPMNNRYPVYSYNHCMLECRIRIILQLCGCLPHFYKPLPSERICTINELKCVRKYKKEIMSLKPKSLVKRRYSRKLPTSPKDCGCLNNCETDIYRKEYENFTYEESLSRLQIGITSFPRIRVVRDILFHANDIILRSGGVINLFIGSSIISFIELVVIMVKLLIYFIYKCFSEIKIPLIN